MREWGETMTFWDGAWGIPLEYPRSHGPDAILVGVLVFGHGRAPFFREDCCQLPHSESRLYPVSGVHSFRHTVHEMWTCVFQAISFSDDILDQVICTSSSWSIWAIPFRKGFRNRPYSLGCSIVFFYFPFSHFNELLQTKYSNGSTDPVYCRFAHWSPRFLPQVPHPAFFFI